MPEPLRVLFVCTGNICRSAMAEAIATARYGGEGMVFESAGTFAVEGTPASPPAVVACGEIGADASGHRARPLDAATVRGADRIFVMTAAHRDGVVAVDPDAVGRVELLRIDGEEVGDPYGSDLETYRAARDEIAAALDDRFGR